MQPIFRVILVIVSLLTMSFMMRKIRQAKVQIEAAMFWVIVALILVVFSLFPGEEYEAIAAELNRRREEALHE